MQASALEKKSNLQLIEEDIGLNRFFPDVVIEQNKVGDRILCWRVINDGNCTAENTTQEDSTVFQEAGQFDRARMHVSFPGDAIENRSL